MKSMSRYDSTEEFRYTGTKNDMKKFSLKC